MSLSIARWPLVVLPLALFGCAHARVPANRFLHGRPPEYRLPAAPSSEPTEALVARVRRVQAEARAERVRPVVPTLEAGDPGLRTALAALAGGATPALHRQVAAQYLRLGVRDLAADHYSAAIGLDPRDAASFEMRARIWRDWGFPDLGLGDAYRALGYAPSAPALNTLGTLFQRLGRYPDARRAYRQALDTEPRAGYAAANLCALDVVEGHAEEALDTCASALALDGGSVVARTALDRALNQVRAGAAGERHEHD